MRAKRGEIVRRHSTVRLRVTRRRDVDDHGGTQSADRAESDPPSDGLGERYWRVDMRPPVFRSRQTVRRVVEALVGHAVSDFGQAESISGGQKTV